MAQYVFVKMAVVSCEALAMNPEQLSKQFIVQVISLYTREITISVWLTKYVQNQGPHFGCL